MAKVSTVKIKATEITTNDVLYVDGLVIKPAKLEINLRDCRGVTVGWLCHIIHDFNSDGSKLPSWRYPADERGCKDFTKFYIFGDNNAIFNKVTGGL